MFSSIRWHWCDIWFAQTPQIISLIKKLKIIQFFSLKIKTYVHLIDKYPSGLAFFLFCLVLFTEFS